MHKQTGKLRTRVLVLGAWAAVAGPLCLFAQERVARSAPGKDGIQLVAQEKKEEEAPPPVPSLDVPSLPGAGGVKPEPLPSIGGTDAQGQTVLTNDPARASGSVDQVLRDSASAAGIGSQRRSAIAFDPRVRNYHIGQLVSYADGAFWTPARIDLDTALGKINPDYVRDITIIRGPYSVRHGPGFAFIDVESLAPERAKTEEFEAYGSSSLTYRTNGQGWLGRQYIGGGNCDWGFRLGYNILAGNDYETGNGDRMPSSYNSHNVDFALGFDLSSHSSLEVKYMRVQQYDVEYPGLLTDINNLAADGVSVRYVVRDTMYFDQLAVDGWYNFTSFEGDSARFGKRRQIPQLDSIRLGGLETPPLGKVRLDIDTEADLYTWGVREAMTWGRKGSVEVTLGADLNIVRQQYDEFESFNFSVSPPLSIAANLGIPKSRSIDPGLFLDGSLPVGDCLTVRGGARTDFVSTELIQLGRNQQAIDPGPVLAYGEALGADAFNTQHFFLWSAFLTGEYKACDAVTYSASYGYAERPPLLTELYTGGAFFGLIQNGLNSIYGNPNLQEERMHQIDLAMTTKYERYRGGVGGFFSYINDYVTYQRFRTGEFFTILGEPTELRQLQFINTEEARILGFEAYAEYDLLPWLAPFATVGYSDGRDLTRHEALPGFAPLEARVGLRLHDPATENPRWGLEFLSRLVAAQEQSAESLGERDTSGFTVFDLRGFWQPREKLLLTAGVENLFDRYYREHLDLRTGRGVFQPGINAYFGMRVSY